MTRRIIGIHEKLPLLESLPLSFQHLTAMFGATILVPILLGIDPAIALLMNGIGTLLYSWVTKGGIPAYLGSSFAFIAPSLLIISTYSGLSHAQSGFIFFGLFFIAISYVVKFWGIKWIDVVMFRGFMQVIPILVAVVAGYFLALAMGLVDTTAISNAAWFALPKFQAPVFDFNAIIIIAPACIVVLAEHISHLIVTG